MDGGRGGLRFGIRYHKCPVRRPLAGAIATILVMVMMERGAMVGSKMDAMLPIVMNEMNDMGPEMEIRRFWKSRAQRLWLSSVSGGAI